MIKATVLYANEPGAQFDHAYYKDRHLPLIQARMGSACKYYTIDNGVSGSDPRKPPPFVALCHIFSNSADEFWAGLLPHFDEINADVSNYTNLKPIIQISDVVIDRISPLG